MKKAFLFFLIFLITKITLSQEIEVTFTPLFVSFDNDLPVLGVFAFKSSNSMEIILCVYVEDDIELNEESDLTILLMNNDIVTGSYISATEAKKKIILNEDISYTSWKFKKAPHAMFSLRSLDLNKLKVQDIKKMVVYRKSTRLPEKKIYLVNFDHKGDLKLLFNIREL